jgi:hypothetical protein
MTSVDDLQKLADQLERSAQDGVGAQLSRQATKLLLAAIRAGDEVHDAERETIAGHLFWIVAGESGRRSEEILGRTSDLSIAKAIFDASVRQKPYEKIRLMRGFDVLEET